MSITKVTSADNKTLKVWSQQLTRQMAIEPFFSAMTGENSIVKIKSNLVGGKGDRIRFALRNLLTGSGVSGSQVLEGNEEALTDSTVDVELDLYRHATRYEAGISEQRNMYSLPGESAAAISEWIIKKMDELAFDAIFASGQSNKMYGGSASSTATLTGTDYLTTTLIRKAKVVAETGNNRSFNPLKPVRINGKDYLVLLVHPHALYNLKENDSKWDQMSREAAVRGSENPLFANSEAIYEGVIIKTSERCPTYSNWGSGANVSGAKCILMGQEALLLAKGKDPYVIDQSFDYDNQRGISGNFILGFKRPDFGGVTHGSVEIDVARTNIAI